MKTEFKQYVIEFKAKSVSSWAMDHKELLDVLDKTLRAYAKKNDALVGESTLYLNEDSNI
jgi:hypothetical protein